MALLLLYFCTRGCVQVKTSPKHHQKLNMSSREKVKGRKCRIAGYIGGNNIWWIARKRKTIAIGGYKFGGYGTIATRVLAQYWQCDKKTANPPKIIPRQYFRLYGMGNYGRTRQRKKQKRKTNDNTTKTSPNDSFMLPLALVFPWELPSAFC